MYIDTNELVQTLIAYDPITTKDGRFCVAVNIGFDPATEMLKPTNEATAWSSCYSYYEAFDDSISEDIDYIDTKTAKVTDLSKLISAQLDSSIKEIKDFVKNNK